MSETNRCKFCDKDLPLDSFETVSLLYLRNTCRRCRRIIRDRDVGNDRDKFFRRAVSGLKYERVKKGYTFEIDSDFVIELDKLQGGICSLTGVLMTAHRDGSGKRSTNASIDRISPSMGYVRENIQLVCWEINRMKGRLAPAEFWFWCENVSRRAGRKDIE